VAQMGGSGGNDERCDLCLDTNIVLFGTTMPVL